MKIMVENNLLNNLRKAYEYWAQIKEWIKAFGSEYGWLFELAVVAVIGFIALIVLGLIVFAWLCSVFDRSNRTSALSQQQASFLFLFFVFVVFVSGFGWYSYQTTKDQSRSKVLKESHDALVSNDDNGIIIYPFVKNERTEDFYEYCKKNEPANPLRAVLVDSDIQDSPVLGEKNKNGLSVKIELCRLGGKEEVKGTGILATVKTAEGATYFYSQRFGRIKFDTMGSIFRSNLENVFKTKELESGGRAEAD
jgi:hypothetical protein